MNHKITSIIDDLAGRDDITDGQRAELEGLRIRNDEYIAKVEANFPPNRAGRRAAARLLKGKA